MWNDIFQSYNLGLLSRLLRRNDSAVIEIVTKDESKYLVEFIRPHKVWKVEEVSSSGFVHVDFKPKLKGCISAISDVERIVMRRRSIEEHCDGGD